MKNIFLILSLSSLFVFSSCHTDNHTVENNSLSQVFETTVDFTNSNDYSQLVNIPSDVEVYESDVILVYWLEDVISGTNGETFDVWTPLPQTIYIDQGSFQYNFNHTFIDVLLFLQGDVNLNSLGTSLTNNQTFRIAVVAAAFAETNPSIEEVLAL
ncbi:MAG: hypothetical protein ACI9RL_000997 [Candidatus Paceibacteria bacterium]|jgi:hypothetical protein